MGSSIIEKFSKEEIIEIISSSFSFKEALLRFGYKKTNNGSLIKKYAEKYNINIEHYAKNGKFIDLTGEKVGKLTVLSYDEERSKELHRTYWKCLCQCGNETSVLASKLRKQLTKSCGCLRKTGLIDDLTGKNFGNLQVIKLDEEKTGKGNSAFWITKCLKCNQISSLRGDTIKERQSFNCNCVKKSKGEIAISNFLKQNNIKFNSQFKLENLKEEKRPLFFDFQIFLNETDFFLLEYQGEQHYKEVALWGGKEGLLKRQKYDSLKKEYCKNNNIRLYEITYKDNLLETLREILNYEDVQRI